MPQGTPTSTHIANLVFLDIDQKLISFCKENNITYSRYVDDLTFSSQQDFKDMLNKLLDIVNEGGFKISYRKTNYKGFQVITGVTVYNNYIDGTQKIIDRASQEQLSQSDSKPYTNYLNRIRETNIKLRKSRR